MNHHAVHTSPSPAPDHHAGHHVHRAPVASVPAAGHWRLALIATAHCLVGCGSGEVVGMLIGMQVGLSNGATIGLAVVLGFIFGLGLGILPLLRAGFSASKALRTVVVAEAIGIAVMEAVDVAVILSIPGAVDAHFTDGFFWFGMAVALAAGYVAALPVNYAMIRAGYRHQH
jgi:hypothetical protein